MGEDGFFDADVAASYDVVHGRGDSQDDKRCVELLTELGGDGAALEFAIGTGRIALPLSAAGVEVQGIELSRAMLAELRKKDPEETVKAVAGDMTRTRVDGQFSLVFLIYNTIDNLTSQDAQVACFGNAATHLQPGGRFLIETLVPPIQKIPFGETRRAFACSEDHWGIDEFDLVSQQYSSHHMRRRDGAFRPMSVPFRYAWPSEMDLMARIAGLKLEHRWADWDKSPFTPVSTRHISVWRKPGG